MMDSMQVDVVVVGSGSAGLTAAVVAARHGLKVLLVEKRARVGGTSAWSGGGCWVPCNSLMRDVGIEDSRAEAEAYVRAVVGTYLRDDLWASFLDEAPRMVDWMRAHTEVRFAARSPFPDTRMDLPGAKIGGRSLASVEYDGKALGSWLSRLEPPLRSFNAPGGMMLAPADVPHAMGLWRSGKSFRHMAQLMARHVADRLRHGRGTRLTMGSALVARLLRSALDAGVTVWTDTPALRLVQRDRAVTGLVVQHEGRERAVEAARGVVLAAGGFSADAQWRARHFPRPDVHEPLVSPGNTADGLRMALQAGAKLGEHNARNGAFDVMSSLRHADGRVERCLHFIRDLPKPGCIVVNGQGRRFANEANGRLAQALLAEGNLPAWLVFDHAFVRRFGAGLVMPFGLNLGAMRRAGYLRQAPTLDGLAQAIGVPAEALQATVSRFNGFAAAGRDDDFGRGNTPGERALGEPGLGRHPSLGALEHGPFHAIRLTIGDAGSVKGLVVDAQARVLGDGGRPIAGLHALGLDMNSIWAGCVVGPGLNHAHNMTFAWIAARALARRDEQARRAPGLAGADAALLIG